MSRPTLVLAALSLCTCTAHELVAPNPRPEVQTDQDIPITRTRKADILFVIDNSLSMQQEQENLARNFPAFIEVLRGIDGGLPDLHVGVVTTDVGAGTLAQAGCNPSGQDGAFQGWDRPCGLQAGSRFLVASDGERTRNYQGDLADVFACMARVGTRGCGYEHQLEAARRALTLHSRAENGAFLRDDAFLQIVFITDEDDCSGPAGSDLYAMSLPGEEASFRCARAGHLCRGQAPPAGDFSVPLSECQPAENGPLTRVSEFVDAIRALKGQPNKIFVAGIFGWPASGQGNYVVGRRGNEGWDYQPACHSENGHATAALRMKQFVEAFGASGFHESICAQDFRPALREIGERLKKVVEGPLCLGVPPVDTSPAAGLQAECIVSRDDRPLPPCPAKEGGTCWRIEPSAACAASGYAVVIDDRGHEPATDSTVGIKCRACARADDPRCQRQP